MSSLKEIRNRIGSIQNTQQITKAMKMVAAAKLRKAQDAIQKMRPYASKLHEITAHVSDSLEDSSAYHKYFQQRELNRVLIIPMTADKGLCGAFNNNIQKLTNKVIKDRYSQMYEDGKLDLLCMGKKGYEFFKKRDFNIVDQYTEFFNKPTFEKTQDIVNQVVGWYDTGYYDRIEIIYNSFKNAATYYPSTHQFLPITSMEDLEENTRANEAGGSDENKQSDRKYDYLFEPSKEEIIEELVPKSLEVMFYKDVLDSSAAEHGSRMTAMDNATENAEELIGDLRLQYNKARQAAITKELSEIVGGAEALSNG